jgi:hypothetical protein
MGTLATGALALSLALALPGVAAADPPDTTPPTTPANLRVTASTDTTVTLAWNPSSDNSGSFYYFLRDNFGTSPTRRSPVPPGSSRGGASVVRGSVPGVNQFVVEAMDGSGNVSGPSNTLALFVSDC